MAEATLSAKWSYRALYGFAGLVIFYIALLPLETVPRPWAFPDIVVCITFAWALRRPDYVPALLVAGLFFLGDMLFQRAPGLQAAAVLLALEFLRSRRGDIRASSFATEWFMVVVAMAGMLVFVRLVSLSALLDPPSLRISVIQLVLTAGIYPLIVALSIFVFKVRYPAVNDISDRVVPS